MGNGNLDCTGKACGFNVDGETVICTSGDGSCFEASILEAEVSGFHDTSLAYATSSIKTTLGAIPKDPQGRKVSILNTNMGLLLAWVQHGGAVPPGAVTANNTDAEIAAALKLRGGETLYATAASGCTGRTCGYNVYDGAVGCTNGDGSCFQALFLEADESGFHDATLAAATTAIRNALAAIPVDANGRVTSILKTRMGLLLARVEHGKPVDPAAVTSKDDDAKIRVALRLKIAAGAGQGRHP